MSRTLNVVSVLTIALGVTISAGIGIFFYFETDVKPALATFAGLLGTIISLQLESSFRQMRAETLATARDKLISRIERVPWQEQSIGRMLGALESIDSQYGSTMAPNFARKSIERCLIDLDSLKRGRFETDVANDFSLLAFSTNLCRRNMIGTSLDALDTDWLTSLGGGRTYWNLQVSALKRGVSIERIFIYSQWTDTLQSVAEEQAEAGVKVLRSHQSKLPDALQIDMAIWDSEFCCQTTLDPSGKPTIGVYMMDSAEVRRRIDQYEIIRSCAEEIPRK